MTSSSGLARSATQYHKASTRKEAAGTSLSPDQRDESTQESHVCDATVHMNEHAHRLHRSLSGWGRKQPTHIVRLYCKWCRRYRDTLPVTECTNISLSDSHPFLLLAISLSNPNTHSHNGQPGRRWVLRCRLTPCDLVCLTSRTTC